jgi:cephalosporin-C deacetylase-like acetyl esterase
MIFRHSLFSIALVASSSLAQQPTAKTLILKAVTDNVGAIYKVGETATFSIESNDASLAKVTAMLSEDGWKPQAPQSVPLTDGKGSLSIKVTKPGFTLLRVVAGQTSAMASAAFDPGEIKPSMPMPDDFDSFWASQKAALAKVPLKFTLTPVTAPAKNVDAFDAQIDCLGGPVSGYFGRPKNAKAKSLPAILFVHGAGVGGSSLGSTVWAEREGGMLAMDINAHGLPNGRPADFYKEQGAGPLKDYRYVGRSDREKNYFKGMFLRLVRAIDFLTAQPEWDGKTVIVYGSSQGGFQAFAAGALDARVSFICAGVPAGCDHTGTVADRINGWPKLVSLTEGKPNAAELQTARYFDNVNFAQRCHAKGAAVTIGFIDTTCPPTSVYAAYNALTIPKKLHIDPLAGHKNTPEAMKFMQEAAYEHVRAMKTTK